MSCDYKVNGKEYSLMSPANNRILSKLVDNEVYCDMTQEIEFIIKTILVIGYDEDAPFTVEDYDDAINNGTEKDCDSCGEAGNFEYYDPMEADETDFHGEDWNPDEPVYTCPICGEEHETLQKARECCQYDDARRCKNCGKVFGEYDFDNLESDIPTIYEWYAISDWLGRKLSQYGEVVIDAYGKRYWGRQGTGQSIILDSVIEQIAYDLEILEGQTHSWEGRIA